MSDFRPPKKASYSDLLAHNTVGCSTVLLDTKVFGRPQFLNVGHEDYALWLSLLRDGGVIYGFNDCLGFYCLRSNSITSNKIKLVKYFWHIYRDIEKFGTIKSAFCCLRYFWKVRNKYS